MLAAVHHCYAYKDYKFKKGNDIQTVKLHGLCVHNYYYNGDISRVLPNARSYKVKHSKDNSFNKVALYNKNLRTLMLSELIYNRQLGLLNVMALLLACETTQINAVNSDHTIYIQ